jgi:DNA-binding NtrC family response regulator
MHEAQAFETSGPKLKALLDAYERRLIEEALVASNGNQRRAASALGLLPTTLHEKMKRLGLLRRPAPVESAGFAGQMS